MVEGISKIFLEEFEWRGVGTESLERCHCAVLCIMKSYQAVLPHPVTHCKILLS